MSDRYYEMWQIKKEHKDSCFIFACERPAENGLHDGLLPNNFDKIRDIYQPSVTEDEKDVTSNAGTGEAEKLGDASQMNIGGGGDCKETGTEGACGLFNQIFGLKVIGQGLREVCYTKDKYEDEQDRLEFHFEVIIDNGPGKWQGADVDEEWD